MLHRWYQFRSISKAKHTFQSKLSDTKNIALHYVASHGNDLSTGVEHKRARDHPISLRLNTDSPFPLRVFGYKHGNLARFRDSTSFARFLPTKMRQTHIFFTISHAFDGYMYVKHTHICYKSTIIIFRGFYRIFVILFWRKTKVLGKIEYTRYTYTKLCKLWNTVIHENILIVTEVFYEYVMCVIQNTLKCYRHYRDYIGQVWNESKNPTFNI